MNEPQIGQIWESKDVQYEPGRRVKLKRRIHASAFEVETVENQRRPHRVGTVTRMSTGTLESKWRLVEEVSDVR